MRLPEFQSAHIDPEKLRGYLLSTTHPIGRFKAAFFGGLGYSADRWEQLEVDLRALVARSDASPADEGKYGRKYVVSGMLAGPSGKAAAVATVWIILRGEETPRFLTAYPGERT